MSQVFTRLKLIFVAGVIALLAGCTQNPPASYHKSAEPVNAEALQGGYTMIKTGAEASLSNYFFFYVPVAMEVGPDTIVSDKLAYKLMQEYSADLLTNVQIVKKSGVTLYWNWLTYTISADVWVRKS